MGTGTKAVLLVLLIGLIAAIYAWDRYVAPPALEGQPDVSIAKTGQGSGGLIPAERPARPVEGPPVFIPPEEPAGEEPPIERKPPIEPKPLFEKKPPVEPERKAGKKDVEPPPAGAKVHVVREGDSYWKIAEEHYGDGTLQGLIREANPQLADRKFLSIGQRLTIPERPAGKASGAETAGGADLPPGSYRVKSGDSLSSIALEQLGGSRHWEAIARANKDILGDDPHDLTVGMVLRIPENPAGRPEAEAAPGSYVPPGLAGKRTYRIRSGDSLWLIAEQTLGNGALWERIYELNRGRIATPTSLKVGEMLELPEEGDGSRL
jgi:nucleoid-associated protein YgaU